MIEKNIFIREEEIILHILLSDNVFKKVSSFFFFYIILRDLHFNQKYPIGINSNDLKQIEIRIFFFMKKNV